MDLFYRLLLLGVVVLLTHFLEGVTGFGCTIIAMPFAILLVGIDVGRPVLTIAALLLCLTLAVKDRKRINVRELLTIVLFMGLGLPVGIKLYTYLPQDLLKKVLAVFMVVVSVRGLVRFFRKRKNQSAERRVDSRAGRRSGLARIVILRVILVFGGVIHGAFTSGGPLAVVYATERLSNKTEFRATLCAMWSLLNGILVAQMGFGGSLTKNVGIAILTVLPFLAGGIFLGNLAHERLKDTWFTPFSFAVLLISSVFMFV